MKILGSAVKQLRIEGRQALNRLDYHKDDGFAVREEGCSAAQNLNQL